MQASSSENTEKLAFVPCLPDSLGFRGHCRRQLLIIAFPLFSLHRYYCSALLKEASGVYSKDKETLSWFVMQDPKESSKFCIVERYEQESSQQ
jgi:hypothetical protein